MSSTALRSARLYVAIRPSRIALFRFLLEAHDNLALFTMVDRGRSHGSQPRPAVLKLRYAPCARQDLAQALHAMSRTVEFSVISAPLEHLTDPA